MAKHLTKLSVDSFRGIKDLTIENTSDINILVGANNSGKTSVLEAMMLLRNPGSFSNVLNVALLREARGFFSSRLDTFEAFISLFNKSEDVNDMRLHITGEMWAFISSVNIMGTIENVMIDPEEIIKFNPHLKRRLRDNEILDNLEAQVFVGKQYFESNGEASYRSIEFSSYQGITGSRIDKSSLMDFTYVSPIEHTSGRTFNRIIRNHEYKDLVIKVLQTFDNDITDLLLIRSEPSNFPVEYIRHNKLGNMPLSTYGDGIKKVILLADRIARAKDSILLIDEIETAIHARSYPDIFSFVLKASVEFNVQLFATTHSIEALDSILKTQVEEKTEKYDKEGNDLIRVITFRKEENTGKTLSRVLSGEKVFKNRENFDFEVRV